MFFVEIEKTFFFVTFISEFRNLKFPELENWELEVPGTWKLRNLGTWELRNLFKGIPPVTTCPSPVVTDLVFIVFLQLNAVPTTFMSEIKNREFRLYISLNYINW